jgi:hypothetical protein
MSQGAAVATPIDKPALVLPVIRSLRIACPRAALARYFVVRSRQRAQTTHNPIRVGVVNLGDSRARTDPWPLPGVASWSGLQDQEEHGGGDKRQSEAQSAKSSHQISFLP